MEQSVSFSIELVQDLSLQKQKVKMRKPLKQQLDHREPMVLYSGISMISSLSNITEQKNSKREITMLWK